MRIWGLLSSIIFNIIVHLDKNKGTLKIIVCTGLSGTRIYSSLNNRVWVSSFVSLIILSGIQNGETDGNVWANQQLYVLVINEFWLTYWLLYSRQFHCFVWLKNIREMKLETLLLPHEICLVRTIQISDGVLACHMIWFCVKARKHGQPNKTRTTI